MSASIQLNGVTTRTATVAFGSTVALTNAAPAGTTQKWEVLDYPLDLDDSGPDFSTNFSSWSPIGDGTYVIVQGASPFASVSFKPDVTGTYLIRLTSTESGGDVTQTAIVRVREVHSGEYLPAAGESSEDDTRQGWKKIVDGRLKRLARRAQGYIRVANVSGGSINRGKVVKLTASVDGHTVSPATNPGGTAAAKSEKLYTITVADNTASGASDADYAILDETLANNAVGWAQKFGLFEGKSDVNYTGFSAGSAVYFDSAGNQINASPGTGVAIPLGVCLETGSTGTISIALAGRSVNQLVSGRPGGNTLIFGLNAGDSGSITSTASSTKGSVNIGLPSPLFTINESLTVVSGSSAVLDSVKVPGLTVTLSGSTNVTTPEGFNYVSVNAPTLTAASALTITSAATLAIIGAPSVSGSAAATNASALRISGSWTHTSNNGHALRLTPSFAPTSGSGVFNGITLQYTINQTGGANGTITGVLVNATETAVVGTHNLLDMQIGGVTKFLVTNAGTLASGSTASANLTLTSTTNATKGKIYLGTAQTAWVDEVNGNPRLAVDGTGLTTTVPVLIKNGKSQTGVAVQVTGSVPSGFVLNDSSGTQKGAFGLVVATNDWVTGTAAGDLVLLGDATKFFHFGALAGSAPAMSIDVANSRLGIGTTSPSVNLHVKTGAATQVTCETTLTSGNAAVRTSSNAASATLTSYGSAASGTQFGANKANSVTLIASVSGVFGFGTVSSSDLVFGTNDTERGRIVSTGGWQFNGSMTVASATSAVWNGVDYTASTLTLTGNTAITTSAGVNAYVFRQPTISAGNALTVTNAATVAIAGAPTAAGVGPATITNPYAFWVQAGASKFDGIVTHTNATGNAFGGSAVASTVLTVSDAGTANNLLVLKATSASGVGIFEIRGSATQTLQMYTNGGAVVGTTHGITAASASFIRASNINFLVIGTDTGAPVVFSYNSAETFRNDGALTLASGKKVKIDSSTSLTDVALQINGDINTGLASPGGADTVSLVAGGAETLRVTSTQVKMGNVALAAGFVVDMCDTTNPFVKWGSGSIQGYLGRVTSPSNAALIGSYTAHALYLQVSQADQMRLNVNSVASGASAVWDAIDHVALTATVSGNTSITTAAGFNCVTFRQPTISAASALTVTNAATVYIANSPTGAGAGPATITNKYSIWVDAGLSRFDGDGTVVFELPADATDPTSGGGAAVGRIPVKIGGVTQYLAYY